MWDSGVRATKIDHNEKKKQAKYNVVDLFDFPHFMRDS